MVKYLLNTSTMLPSYQLLQKEKLSDSNQYFYFQMMIDDSGYQRWDAVIDEDGFEERQWDGKNEPKGILVFLDTSTRIRTITSGYEEAISHYDNIPSPLPNTYCIDLYHRLVSKDAALRGSQLLDRAIQRFQKNTNIEYITCKETEQYSVAQRLLKNEFQIKDKTTEELKKQLEKISFTQHHNIYGYTEHDRMLDEEEKPICLSMFKKII